MFVDGKQNTLHFLLSSIFALLLACTRMCERSCVSPEPLQPTHLAKQHRDGGPFVGHNARNRFAHWLPRRRRRQTSLPFMMELQRTDAFYTEEFDECRGCGAMCPSCPKSGTKNQFQNMPFWIRGGSCASLLLFDFWLSKLSSNMFWPPFFGWCLVSCSWWTPSDVIGVTCHLIKLFMDLKIFEMSSVQNLSSIIK